MSIVSRIKETASLRGITSLSALESAVGLGNGTIGKWDRQSPSCSKIQLVANYLNTSIDFLVTGKTNSTSSSISADEQELLAYYSTLDSMSKGKVIGKAETLAEQAAECQAQPSYSPVITESKCAQGDIDLDDRDYISIPFIDLPVSAGCGADLLDQSDEDPIRVPDTRTTSLADYALRISGDSMEPMYHDGDIVLIAAQDCVDDGQIGIFVLDGKGYIKRQQRGRLVSLNPAYEDIQVHDYDSFRCMGLVVGTL